MVLRHLWARMAGVILYCKLCGCGYGSIGDMPVICPSCNRETKWSTMAPEREPVAGWNPNESDRRLLRGLRIDPE